MPGMREEREGIGEGGQGTRGGKPAHTNTKVYLRPRAWFPRFLPRARAPSAAQYVCVALGGIRPPPPPACFSRKICHELRSRVLSLLLSRHLIEILSYFR